MNIKMKKFMTQKIWIQIVLATCMSFLSDVFAQDNRVLMNVGGNEVTVDEFLAIYNKNNNSNIIDQKSMEEYLDLFINFKLKVREAEALGMDTAPRFMSELAGYRRQLAQPYLIDRQTNEELIREAYERMKYDVHASHILIKIPADAKPADTLKALQKISELREKIKSEADLIKIMDDFKNDNDPSTIAEDLGYFTVFDMVYPFETAAYKTPVGSVSEPVRTQFGYHLVFVHDRRPARGEIKVSHIMVRSLPTDDEQKQVQAKARIDEIYTRLMNGESFEDLVKAYSDDKATAENGGQLPWFGTGRYAIEFEDAAFALENNGDISRPVKTAYGWHIIRRDDYRPIPSFENARGEIKRRIERDSRGLKGRKSLLNKLKSEYNITYNYKSRDEVHRKISSDYLNGTWNPEGLDQLNNLVMVVEDPTYTNEKRTYTQQDYIAYLKRNQRGKTTAKTLQERLDEQWNGFVNAMLINFENEILDKKYPEFKALMQEYHDGILLFDLMDQKVWSKAVKDSAGLANYFEQHRDNYMWPERVDASIYVCADEKTLKKARKLAKKRVKKGLTDSEIHSELTEENPLAVTIQSGLYAKGDNPLIDRVQWQSGLYETTDESGKPVLVQIYNVIPPQHKKLSECRGLVTSDYQSYLEQEWIRELREKYDFEVNDEVFDSIKK
ncbi:MAG: peptidylprolyl isomerase [Salibacteraceae bacterium]